MSRCRILWDRRGKLAEYSDEELIWLRDGANEAEAPAGPQVMRDISPYKSMINGQMITSRSQHRTHLKDHGCIEVGNDTSHLKPRVETPVSPSRRESLHRMLGDVSDREVNNIVARTVREMR